MNKKKLVRGFTIAEISVVMVIIGILASMTYLAYTGLQIKARDVSVLSDIDRMDALQTSYGLKNGTAGISYYSVDGVVSDLPFTPSSGNVVKVEVNSLGYCIRGYNTSSTKNSIDNAATKESSPGVCAALAAIDTPTGLDLTVTQNSGTVTATIIPATCPSAGEAEYGVRSLTNDGTWTDYTDWSTTLTDSQTANYGIRYGYQVQARCFANAELISATVESSEVIYIHNVPVPTTPVVTVGLSGSNIVATAAPVTCAAGTVAQYGFNSHTNDSATWTGFSVWSIDNTSSVAALQGTKYGYIAQARCYVDTDVYSTTVAGSEGIYINPITTVPAIPANVRQSTPEWDNTYYAWNAVTCPTNTWPLYSYYSWNDSGWNSGWQTTTGLTAYYSSSHFGWNYYLKTKAQCVSSYTTGGFSGESANAGYYRGVPTIQVLIVGGGGGGSTSSVDASGAGGGGGGVVQTSMTVSNGNYNGVTVGAGGSAGYPSCSGVPTGDNSSFPGLPVAYGGGDGGWTNGDGCSGASGGGGAGAKSGSTNTGGSAYQGQPGATGFHSGGYNRGAGGGGYGSAGSGMNGGNGFYSWLTGQTYAGGGGGASVNACGSGGSGGGGAGGCNTNGVAGTPNTGGGGGGGGGGGWGQPGGSGIVVIRYNGHQMGAGCASTGYWIDSNDVIQKYFGSGTFCVYG